MTQFKIVKFNQRLWIFEGETPSYTPPDFIRNRCYRHVLQLLCDDFNMLGTRDIHSIIQFETSFDK